VLVRYCGERVGSMARMLSFTLAALFVAMVVAALLGGTAVANV
jgi:hypothetical protein